ncbi:group II intron reverse transcriptase/maturase [Salisediminibacterium selenitireducens]|nr:group II intron reverse transcriptase/maturase [Salisediminibacterium selenitireducens]
MQKRVAIWQRKESKSGMQLIDRVVCPDNLNLAMNRVISNKGNPGVDGMTVDQLEAHVRQYAKPLIAKIQKGTYQPLPVKRVEIPKENGKKRKLGIPAVRDRMVQQAIFQVIEPIIDPHFSPNSYGFRPGKNAKQAIKQAAKYYDEGFKMVVDIDLKSYFDTIPHQKLMNYLEQYIQDPIILKLIWKFLKSGIMIGDNWESSRNGAPQGGNLSPILSNVYLHELDKELERRGHRFVRYADDFCIYVKSRRAAERVLLNTTTFLEGTLKLSVNQEKSAIGSPTKRKFLGFCIHKSNNETRCRPHHASKAKFKAKLKYLTRRNQANSFDYIILKINQVTTGWINYYGISYMKSFINSIKQWLHHRLRQLIWKQWKKIKTRYKNLMKYGIETEEAWKMANTRKGYWRASKNETLHKAIKIEKLAGWGLKDMSQLYERAYSTY